MGFIRANITFALRNPELRDELKEYLATSHNNMHAILDYGNEDKMFEWRDYFIFIEEKQSLLILPKFNLLCPRNN